MNFRFMSSTQAEGKCRDMQCIIVSACLVCGFVASLVIILLVHWSVSIVSRTTSTGSLWTTPIVPRESLVPRLNLTAKRESATWTEMSLSAGWDGVLSSCLFLPVCLFLLISSFLIVSSCLSLSVRLFLFCLSLPVGLTVCPILSVAIQADEDAALRRVHVWVYLETTLSLSSMHLRMCPQAMLPWASGWWKYYSRDPIEGTPLKRWGGETLCIWLAHGVYHWVEIHEYVCVCGCVSVAGDSSLSWTCISEGSAGRGEEKRSKHLHESVVMLWTKNPQNSLAVLLLLPSSALECPTADHPPLVLVFFLGGAALLRSPPSASYHRGILVCHHENWCYSLGQALLYRICYPMCACTWGC